MSIIDKVFEELKRRSGDEFVYGDVIVKASSTLQKAIAVDRLYFPSSISQVLEGSEEIEIEVL